jgi:hypothetical protein
MIASRRFLCAGVAGLGAAAALAAGVAARPALTPHIGVKPRSVMVNGTTMLSGRGFPANSLVHLQECTSAAWIVPQDPCDTANEITVMTGPTGRFSTSFTVQLCPREVPPKPPVTRERCYIGEPQLTGEDTMGLLGAAKLTVTYP